MKWVTRGKVHVDRVACPWLISRFIDPEAEFIFVPGDTDPATITEGIPFDMHGVELGHHGENCSFDAFVTKYGISDPALHKIQEIVHDADANGGKGLALGAALRIIAEGYALLCRDDYDVLEKECVFYDALYAYFRSQSGCDEGAVEDCATCTTRSCGSDYVRGG